MTRPENEKPYSARKKRARAPLPVFFFVVLCLIVALGAGWFFFLQPEQPPVITETQEPIQAEEKDLAPIKETERDPETTGVARETTEDGKQKQIADEGPATGPLDSQETIDEPRQECDLLAENLHAFFNHLDQQDYIQAFELDQPSQDHFLALADTLFENPPVVSRETDDLYTILKNMAHFFRIIGRKNIIIMKGILDREPDTIEDVASDMYQWTLGETCESDEFTLSAPLDKLYEYAGFFLNTMGGRSYLFRRDSRSRLLVNYYAILIVDRANEQDMNQHGIEIIQSLPLLIQEIESTNHLIYKENYLDRLYDLMEKYQ